MADPASPRADAAATTVEAWLEPGPDFELVDVEVDGASVEVEVRGPGEPPSSAALQAARTADLGRSASLQLRVIPVVLNSSWPLPIAPS